MLSSLRELEADSGVGVLSAGQGWYSLLRLLVRDAGGAGVRAGAVSPCFRWMETRRQEDAERPQAAEGQAAEGQQYVEGPTIRRRDNMTDLLTDSSNQSIEDHIPRPCSRQKVSHPGIWRSDTGRCGPEMSTYLAMAYGQSSPT